MKCERITSQVDWSCSLDFISKKLELVSGLPNCSAVLLPIVITGYVTYWFVEFFDNFFSPLYEYLFGFHVFGLGFITSLLFIFATGVFTSVSDILVVSHGESLDFLWNAEEIEILKLQDQYSLVVPVMCLVVAVSYY